MAIPARREKDRWHQLADLIQDSNLPASDKSVFRYLLDRSNYRTGELAARFAPLQATIGRKTSHSPRQVRYAIRHLERHGWLAASRNTQEDSPDRRRLRYELAFGGDCDCTGRVHDPATGKRQPQAQIAATTDPYIAATDSGNAAGQHAVPTERQREEGSKGGFERKPATEAKATSARLPPDWPLIREVVRVVHADPCGGIHRKALAEMLHLPARGRSLSDALVIAYKNKKIDFCGQYVVKPVKVPGHD